MLTGFGDLLIARGETPPHVDRVLAKPVRHADLREALELAVASRPTPGVVGGQWPVASSPPDPVPLRP